MSVLVAVTTLGCGGSGDVCDIGFGTIAGAYSFTYTTHDVRYQNSCFDSFSEPQPDPATMTHCTWSEETDEEKLVIELVIEEDGNVGSARITNIESDGDTGDVSSADVKCEMLEGEICDAPIRCSITGQMCESDSSAPDAEDWKYLCNCAEGSGNDETGSACQQCKGAYDQYMAERKGFCEKSQEGDYVEFTLHVKE